MKMNEIINIVPAFFAGIILGILFFGGLWLTIQKGMRTKYPSLVFMASFVLRISVTLAGFYFVCSNSWEKMITCLAGFIIARMIITRYVRKNESSNLILKRMHHEA